VKVSLSDEALADATQAADWYIYRVEPAELRVIAVAAQRRRPGYGAGRH
jgi:hypothetical protein